MVTINIKYINSNSNIYERINEILAYPKGNFCLYKREYYTREELLDKIINTEIDYNFIKKNWKLTNKCYFCYDKGEILDNMYEGEQRLTDNTFKISSVKRSHQALHICKYINIRVKRYKGGDIFLFNGNSERAQFIKSILTDRISYAKRKLFIEKNINKKCHIYSGQWGAYWRENKRGYTDKKEEAGIYSVKEAWEATSHCGAGKYISYELIKEDGVCV